MVKTNRDRCMHTHTHSYGPDKSVRMGVNMHLHMCATWMKSLNGTSNHKGVQLCQIILKSIHNLWSGGNDVVATTVSLAHRKRA